MEIVCSGTLFFFAPQCFFGQSERRPAVRKGQFSVPFPPIRTVQNGQNAAAKTAILQSADNQAPRILRKTKGIVFQKEALRFRKRRPSFFKTTPFFLRFCPDFGNLGGGAAGEYWSICTICFLHKVVGFEAKEVREVNAPFSRWKLKPIACAANCAAERTGR